MTALFDDSGPGNAGRTHKTSRRREGGLPWMSAQQAEAYLIARDTLRRIQRTAPLLRPALDPRFKAHPHRDHSAQGGTRNE